MDLITTVMGLADITCAVLLIIGFGMNPLIYGLGIVMVVKGGSSFF